VRSILQKKRNIMTITSGEGRIMALTIHLELTGKSQGKINGSCDMAGREDSIFVHAMNQRTFIPHNPQDGLPTGKRKHAPITIIKEVDGSTPSLYQALVTGEQFSNVIFKFYRISPQGNQEHYYTLTLEDAVIISVSSKKPKTFLRQYESFGSLEMVSFCYSKITANYEPDGIEAEDNNCTASCFADDFKHAMTSIGSVVAKTLSNYGHKFSSHMEKGGADVIEAMSSDHCQSMFGQFVWSATFSPTSLIVDDSDLSGTGGVINNVPVTKASMATIAASLFLKKQ
jgi:type VI secretion system secreted protein Hcp